MNELNTDKIKLWNVVLSITILLVISLNIIYFNIDKLTFLLFSGTIAFFIVITQLMSMLIPIKYRIHQFLSSKTLALSITLVLTVFFTYQYTYQSLSSVNELDLFRSQLKKTNKVVGTILDDIDAKHMTREDESHLKLMTSIITEHNNKFLKVVKQNEESLAIQMKIIDENVIPDRLVTRQGRQTLREAIVNYKKLMLERDDIMLQKRAFIKSKFEASLAGYQSFWAGFNRGAQYSKSLSDNMIHSENQYLQTVSSILAFLNDREWRFHLVGDEIKFDTPVDNDIYYRLTKKLAEDKNVLNYWIYKLTDASSFKEALISNP